jgi:hypothetical protein
LVVPEAEEAGRETVVEVADLLADCLSAFVRSQNKDMLTEAEAEAEAEALGSEEIAARMVALKVPDISSRLCMLV